MHKVFSANLPADFTCIASHRREKNRLTLSFEAHDNIDSVVAMGGLFSLIH
jgi:hypothetical protein